MIAARLNVIEVQSSVASRWLFKIAYLRKNTLWLEYTVIGYFS